MEYGAYVIRKEHHRNMFCALLLSIGLLGGVLLAISRANGAAESKAPIGKLDWSTLVNITPIDKPKEDKQDKTKQHVQPLPTKPAGVENNEIVVTTEPVAKPIASDLDKKDKQLGGDGDEPTGEILQPYTPSSDGELNDGNNGPKKKPARRWAVHMPEYPGGEEAMMRYMIPQVGYSERDKEDAVEGTMYISFVVEADGSISGIIIERGIANGERLARRAVEAIKKMPRWKPGDDGSQPLAVTVTMPLNFQLLK